MSTPAGWYPNGDQWETYWDGNAWTDQNRPRVAAVSTPVPDAVGTSDEEVPDDLQAGNGVDAPLLEFTSHINGKNAKVQVWADRLEWTRPRGVSGAKVTAAAFTLGASALATGLRNGKTGTEMIPVKAMTSVTTKRDGMRNTLVSVITSGNTVDFRISHKEAELVKTTLTQLMLGNHPSQQLRAPRPAAATPPTSTAAAPVDVAAQLQQLASLREAGILTEEEFTAKKTELLARF